MSKSKKESPPTPQQVLNYIWDDLNVKTSKANYLKKNFTGYLFITPGSDKEEYQETHSRYENDKFKQFVKMKDLFYCLMTLENKKCIVYDSKGNVNQYMGNLLPNNVLNMARTSKMTPEQLKSEVLKYIGGDYKIHLQVKPEHILDVVKKLLKLWNNKLKDEIWMFKVIGDENFRDQVEIRKMPVIVIYPKHGYNHAQKVVDVLADTFKDDKIGLGITPRYNERLTDLIYAAGGDGDYKKLYAEKYKIFQPPEYVYYINQKPLKL